MWGPIVIACGQLLLLSGAPRVLVVGTKLSLQVPNIESTRSTGKLATRLEVSILSDWRTQRLAGVISIRRSACDGCGSQCRDFDPTTAKTIILQRVLK